MSRNTPTACNLKKQFLLFAFALFIFSFKGFGQNAIVTENALTGTPSSVWDVDGAGDLTIQGFGTDISVNKGDTIHFKINTDAHAYTIDIYRLGYYQGNGARKVGTGDITASLPQTQPDGLYDPNTGLLDCGNWTESAYWHVPSNAVSGIYIAKLTRTDNGGSSHMAFIVRDDANNSKVYFKASVSTWQAYNAYGGNSLYVGSTAYTSGHAAKVSFNRPFITRNGGGGGGVAQDWLFNAEYPMIRWLEANGYDLTYTTDVDADRYGSLLLNHKAVLSVGHDEYWSGQQRTNFEAARNAGVHLAFFSGNEIYWKTRWENSVDGSNTPYRTLVCYKEGQYGENVCGNKCDPDPNVWTGLWRDGCDASYGPNDGCRPENALSGQISWDGTTGTIQVPDNYKNLRFWRNTSIANLGAGQTATFPDGTLGYEWDWEQYPASYPAGRIQLSSTLFNTHTHHLSLYRHTSGALVFGAGTVQWSWGLDSHHDNGSEPADVRMQQATVNLLADMGVQPASLQSGLVAAIASTDTQGPTSVITSPAPGALLPNGSHVTITGTAIDNVLVAGIEVSVDNGATWVAATGTTNWTFSWTPTTQGPITIKCRAIDDSGNMEAEGTVPAVNAIIDTVSAPLPVVCPCTIFQPTDSPAVPLANDQLSAELGVKFRADEDGYITGLRFYKGVGATGTHMGHLWTSTGTLLAGVTYTNESASGWQQVNLGTSVAITAGTTYVASYYSTSGDYAFTDMGFTQPVIHGPLQALADGVDGPNGVYIYFGDPAFPTNYYQSSNYWADVVFNTYVGPDTTAPIVVAVSPTAGAGAVDIASNISATFNEAIDPSTLSITSFLLYDSANNLVPATVFYNTAAGQAILDPSSLLNYSSTYKVVVKGGTGYQRIKDIGGNAMLADYSWTFTTGAVPPPPPNDGPGGPILLISAATNPFSRYPVEILRAEGFNEFTAMDISAVNSTVLNSYDVVIVGNIPLSTSNVTMLTDWTTAGGTLIALRPDAQLAPLLGLTPASGTLDDKYLLVKTSSGPGAGIVNKTMQYHSSADLYTLNGATSLATLYSNATTATTNPAVTSRTVGTNGGQAFAFTYDLAKSVVYTRQGNPLWAGQKRDGQIDPIRSDDMYFPDWIDFNKVAIPQADEQQHLFSNIILKGNLHRKPLPKFWFLPKGLKAAIVQTGDDHGDAGMQPRFDIDIATSTAGCSVENWDCIRSTGYLYVGSTFTDSMAKHYNDLGFEVALHVLTNCQNYTQSQFQNFITTQMGGFNSTFPSIPTPVTNRNHCIAWSDFSMPAEVEAANGIRFDVNYYYWPESWILDRPGMFTGSGMPMRFAKADGTIIDCYQATTQMPDESGESFPMFCDALMDSAIGTPGYYGVFTTNMHFDNPNHPRANAVVASAQARGIPVVTSKQMLDWVDGRNGSSFGSIAWNSNSLSFNVAQGTNARNLKGMVPFYAASGQLTGITLNGTPVTYTSETVKGVLYAFFNAITGGYVATYSTSDTTTPVITNIAAIPHSDGTATITWNTNEAATSDVAYAATPNALTSNSADANLVTSHSITLTGLTQGVTYNFRVSSADAFNNNITSPLSPDSLSFTMPIGPCIKDQSTADFNLGTVNAGALVALEGDGAIVLNPALVQEFSGTSTPLGWGEAIWDGQAGAATTYSGSHVNANGTHIYSNFNYGPGSSVEFTATYTAGNFQNIGFTSDIAFDAPWIVIGRGGTADNNVYARTSDGSSSLLGSNLLGTPHKYRIQWNASYSFSFYVDGVLIATPSITQTVGTRMLVQISNYAVGGAGLTVDWIRVSPYTSSGSFSSQIFDGGSSRIWEDATWNAEVPSGTTLSVFARAGNTATPDGNWTAFKLIDTSGAVIGDTSRYIQYRVDLATADSNLTPVFKDISIDCATPINNITPLIITNITAAPHNDGTATITWTTNQASTSLVAYGTSPLTQNTGDSNIVISHSIILSGLLSGTTYYFRVFSRDSTGAATYPAPPDSLSFMMPALPCVNDQTTSDFNFGTVDANTMIISDGDGAVSLKSALFQDFSGTTTPADWGDAIWDGQSGAATTYNGGVVTVDGSHAYTNTTFGPGSSLDFVATFSSGNFQNVGFTADAAFDGPWVVIGRGGVGDNNVYARTSDLSSVVLGSNLLNAPHQYRIQWNNTTNDFQFYVDGTLIPTPGIALTVSSNMNVQISDYPVGGVSLTVDWVRVTPYATAGSFTSKVFDAGTSTTWGITSWLANLPSNTSISIYIRTGNTPIPDGTWSSFAQVVSSGNNINITTRYIQYRADLLSSDVSISPELESVSIACSSIVAGDTTRPVITNVIATPASSGISAIITWITNENANSIVHYNTDSGSLTLNSSNSGLVINHTINLTGLTPGNIYYYTVTSIDSSGNSATSSIFSFTAPMPASPCFEDKAFADFNLGVTGSSTYVSLTQSGEVTLKPAAAAEFNVLPSLSDWNSFPWSGGTSSVSGGVLSVNGARYNSEPAGTTFGPGRSLEFIATFGASGFQHIGFGGGTDAIGTGGIYNGESPWAMFSTKNTTNTLYARTFQNSTTVSDFSIPGSSSLIGSAHRYRIDWKADGTFAYYVDGSLVWTEPISITGTMRPAISDYNNDATPITVDWIRMTPYPAQGSFESRIYDAGSYRNWDSITWQTSLPVGTAIGISVREGNTPLPDSTWTSYFLIPSSGNNVGGVSRYIQYKADLSSSDSSATPLLQDVTIYCSAASDTGPMVTVQPVPQAMCAGGNAILVSKANGTPQPSVQWQVSTDGGNIWNNISGANNDTVRFVTNVSDNHKQFRAVWTNIIGSVNSNVAVLTIGAAPTATIAAVNTHICNGDSIQLQLTSASGQPPFSLVVNNTTYTGVTSGQIFSTISPASVSIWENTGSPANPSVTDNSPIETGTKFRSSVSGYVNGIRFYKGVSNTGIHIASLWTTGGIQLATDTFTAETASGWQEVRFATPVAIQANTTYIASYFSAGGYFAISSGFFASTGVTNGPLTALQAGVDGPNGVYKYGGGFPDGGNTANYWVDVLFSQITADSSFAYSLTSVTDNNGCSTTGNPLSTTNVTINPAPVGTINSGNVCAGDSLKLVFSAAQGTGPFALTINGSGYSNVNSGVPFYVGIATLTTHPVSIWDSTVIGGEPTAFDDGDIELGVKFRSVTGGQITGIRFYKRVSNTGTHTGSLWSSSGTQLATATFTSESASGWQQVNFAILVTILPNVTYVASYHAPTGNYAFTKNYFTAGGITTGPITGLQSGVDGGNGVFQYGSGTLFPNQSYNDANYWVDVIFTTTGGNNYSLTHITDAKGCSTAGNPISSISVTVNPGTSSSINQTACNQFTMSGQTYTASGVYTQRLTNSAGCDSTVTLNLVINHSDSSSFSVTACSGYTWNGQTYTASGRYTQTLANVSGCDSFVVLTLTVNPTFTTPISAHICQGSSYAFNGQSLTGSGIYRDTLSTVNGCDSFVVLTLTINPTFTTPISAHICQGASYSFNGQSLTIGGIYRDTLFTVNGCDSFVVLTLTVNPTYTTPISAHICQGASYSFNGQSLTTGDVYRDTLSTVNGCDSFVVLTLTVNPTFTTPISAQICQGTSYNFNGQSLTTGGIYRDTLSAVSGCDSFVVLTLTVNPTFTTPINAHICQGASYSFNGQSLTTGGVYRDTLSTINGCDSFVVLTLAMNPTFTTPINARICQGASYSFNGQSLTSGGIYRDTLATVNGCDSFLVLTLTVNPTFTTSISAHICQSSSYSFNGQSLTTGGVYRDTLSTVSGCDSFVVLTLTVNPTYTTPINASICQGASYGFNGQSLTSGGVYRDTLSTVNDCDSFVVLTLTVNPTYTTPINAGICQGASYSFNGQSLTSGGIYRDTLSTVNGCDSFVVLTLTVNPTFTTPISAQICQGTSYSFNGQSLTTGGVYRDTLSTINGCDSFVVLVLTVNPVPVVNLGNDTAICSGNTVALNAGNAGSNFHWSHNSNSQILDVSSTGAYSVTVTNSSNCSASATINVNVQQAPVVNLGNDLSTCGDNIIELFAGNAGSTFQWSNGSVNGYIKVSNSGTYSVTVTDSLGCTGTDSIRITFKALPVIPALSFATICNAGFITLNAGNAGSNYLWNDSSVGQTLVVSTVGDYEVTVTDTSGCSSIGTFMVSGETLSVNLNSNITFCTGDSATLDARNAGSTYQWSNNLTSQTITTNIPGVYSVTITSLSGCTATGNSTLTLVSPGPVFLELNPHIICSTVAAGDLSGGLPAGGIYSGSSVSSGVFYPAAVGPGKYPITYTISDSGCSASVVDTITVNDCTELSDINNPMEIRIYPNPNGGNFELLMLNSYLNDFNIEVVDIDGRIISQMDHERANAEYIKTFNLSDIAKGVYFVRVITDQEIIVRRVVIQ